MATGLNVVLHLFVGASRVQRKRAALTIAAIAWGTLTLMLLLAFGEGLARQLNKARSGLGNNIAVVWPGETSKVWRRSSARRPSNCAMPQKLVWNTTWA